MSNKPQAYEPAEGYKYQILTKYAGEKAYEHCDYARDDADKKHLLNEYRLAYGAAFKFKTILLPQKYWKDKGELTKAQALANFRLYNVDWLKENKKDIPARRQAWHDYTDMLCKDGQITKEQYNTWDNPF
ncbi:hypothetical protein MKY96_33455 [Paenibacillus sp. FSL R7-0302]|uniref:hypothetical protein n=1 Tax=Paenibacillus sp. FSL R7-0302 TaxID=2921681 RepID=UPI0030F62AB4